MGEQHRRVLVVDDDSSIRQMIVSAFRRSGLTVDEAADGREAIDLIRVNDYAVILLDLLMPNVDGFTVLQHLPHDAPFRPVVLVVTGADRAALESLDAQRIHGVVRKPFDIDEISKVVTACADIRERNQFGAMAIATMIAGGPLLAWLHRLP